MTMTYVPSGNVAQLRESATIAVSQKARALRAQGRRIIDLGAGEPDFETPEFIRSAAKRALDEGATRYTAVEGIVPLRQAIADLANEQAAFESPIGPKEVMVTTGSKQALFNACFALFGEGDEVLIPTPAWTSYYEMVELARARAVPVEGDPGNGFMVTRDELDRAATARTRGVMLNSPCNPTGAVYSAEAFAELVELATERDWWIVSDEIYRHIAYNGSATSALAVASSRDRLVVVDGMAKAFAMTGWRIGWSIAPEHVTRTMTAFQSHTTSNATTVAQHAALTALRERGDAAEAVAGMVREYQRRRDAAVKILTASPGLRFVRPDGAFYLFIDVQDTARPEDDAGALFAARLLDEHGVAVVPGSAFRTPGWIRVSYAAAEADVIEGLNRILALRSRMQEQG